MAKKRAPTASKKESIGDALTQRQAKDRASLVASGMTKLAAGQSPTREESRAVREWEKDQAERHGDLRIREFPKGEFARRMGRAPKVLIDVFRRHGLRSYATTKASLDRDALDVELIDLLIRGPNGGAAGKPSIKERRELVELERQEFELARLKEKWVPLDLLRPILDEALVGRLRAMIDDYDKREKVTPSEVASRLRQEIKQIGRCVDDALGEDGEGG